MSQGIKTLEKDLAFLKHLLQNETGKECFKTIGHCKIKISINDRSISNTLNREAGEWALFYSGKKINCMMGKYFPLPKSSFPILGF